MPTELGNGQSRNNIYSRDQASQFQVSFTGKERGEWSERREFLGGFLWTYIQGFRFGISFSCFPSCYSQKYCCTLHFTINVFGVCSQTPYHFLIPASASETSTKQQNSVITNTQLTKLQNTFSSRFYAKL